jgi:hypothetical protein
MEDQRAADGSLQDGTAAQRFAEQLRALRASVGNPSFRKMSGRSGRISHTTLHEAAAGTRFPSWETTREFVRACEADEAQWQRRWQDAQRPGSVHTVPDGDTAPAGAASPAEVTGPDTVAAGTAHAADSPAAGTSGRAAAAEPAPVAGHAPRAAEHPPAAGPDELAGARRRLPTLATAAAVVVALAAVLGFTVRGWSAPDGPGAAAASPSPSLSPSAFSDASIPGDASRFVADVTIPDGTRVKVNARFVKVWAIANVGKVGWHNRFLARMNPTGDEDGCRVPDRVPIGDTPPGEQVMISVPVTAPSRPGKCWVSWKMVDEHGRPFFPSRRPVYFMVTVTA